MKLFVFVASAAHINSIIADNTRALRLQILLAGGSQPWIDTDDTAVADTEDAIRATYLQPNGIPVTTMGRLGTTPRAWWVAVDPTMIRLQDFYSVEEAVAADIFSTDPTALAWKTHYIFLDAAGNDLIGSLGYLGNDIEAPLKEVLPKLLTAIN